MGNLPKILLWKISVLNLIKFFPVQGNLKTLPGCGRGGGGRGSLSPSILQSLSFLLLSPTRYSIFYSLSSSPPTLTLSPSFFLSQSPPLSLSLSTPRRRYSFHVYICISQYDSITISVLSREKSVFFNQRSQTFVL